MKNLIVLSSPSGAGKSTLSNHLLELYPELRFSVSATTRTKRADEVHGKDYYFFSSDQFDEAIRNDQFIEFEEVFGNRYGTLFSEVQEAIINNEKILFDIDVKGAMSIKKAFPRSSSLVFIAPPTMKEIGNRLRARGTESEEQIVERMKRAEYEYSFKDQFDFVIVNDDLEKAKEELANVAKDYLS